jgi:hypothetical protein
MGKIVIGTLYKLKVLNGAAICFSFGEPSKRISVGVTCIFLARFLVATSVLV